MELGCLFPPTLATPAHIEQAEALGYRRAYVYDSPAFLARYGPMGPDIPRELAAFAAAADGS
jgi:hypothetical protein